MDIEQIFQEEVNNYNSQYREISSLVLEFGDLYSKYIDLRDQFKLIVIPNNFNQHDFSILLQKHIDIVTQISNINKSIADIFHSFSSNSKEV